MKDLMDLFVPFFLIFSPILLGTFLILSKKGKISKIFLGGLTAIFKFLSLIAFGSYEHISNIMDDVKKNNEKR